MSAPARPSRRFIARARVAASPSRFNHVSFTPTSPHAREHATGRRRGTATPKRLVRAAATSSEPPTQASRKCLSSLRAPDLRERGAPLRRSLEAYFENSWTLTEVLFSSLRTADAYYRPPAHGLRHAKVFYYGHPAALAVNKLRVAGALTAGLDDEFDVLFETGVDEMTWDDLATPGAVPSRRLQDAQRASGRVREHLGETLAKFGSRSGRVPRRRRPRPSGRRSSKSATTARRRAISC